MYHFFVDRGQMSADCKQITITGSDFNHMVNVLRMKVGEEFSVSIRQEAPVTFGKKEVVKNVDSKRTTADSMQENVEIPGREYRYGIEEILPDSVLGTLRFIKEDEVELPARIVLFQGLPKADKMELIVQKAVELGAAEIVPVSMKRCVVKLDEKKAKNKVQRWQTIAEAAAKQSKRRVIPKVSMPLSMTEAVKYASEMDVKLLPYELADGMPKTKQLIESVKPGQSIAIFIGPEGGFEEKEVAMATEAGAEVITLGKRILRTETAGFTVIAWLMYQLEL